MENGECKMKRVAGEARVRNKMTIADSQLEEFLSVAEDAARAAGAILQDWAGRFTVSEKGPADLVTEADVASQAEIHRILSGRFPDHGFVGEESHLSTPGG